MKENEYAHTMLVLEFLFLSTLIYVSYKFKNNIKKKT